MRRLFRAFPASCLTLPARLLVVAPALLASPCNQIDFCLDSLQPRYALSCWATQPLIEEISEALPVQRVRHTVSAGSASEMAIDCGFSGRSDPCEQFVWAYLIGMKKISGLGAANAQSVKSLCSANVFFRDGSAGHLDGCS